MLDIYEIYKIIHYVNLKFRLFFYYRNGKRELKEISVHLLSYMEKIHILK